ncbi:cell wall associated biofilm protein [Enterococcus durans]|uniref:cell wall associated biofilm protein n=1 Tax=Enterococcus durans TaxID=53345 RepID=UPI00232C9AD5|nr:cell wall associated biofilm protein [Enterococcus durans]MDB1654015.1 cell wall associated biofilm protein [Enterococcus durans]MDB1656388.1 cell wall associated biofilm protein [Enterococcus durans]MDB1664817.1 cell wall associated biofilm protein [Enterococcus durans]MDB1670084.1 cell wall associated biofilm protein [Enterococcus durans]MDB1672340.1 cell wall associated biofilm protein [Enterococcus durans]
MKNFRTIATSLLLFQHCLFPVTIFAEEAPVEIDTELVQRLQEQNELPAIESNPPTTESTAEEPVHTEPAEVPTTEDSNPEQPEQSEQPKQPETVETTEPPIPETSEETVETTTPSAEDGKESSEGNGLPSPVLPKEEETEQLMVLPEAMRMSTYSLPNLNEYRHHLVDNGRSAYIEGKMQRATNRELTLGAGAGAVQRFTVTFDAYTMVQAPGNGWISWIASNLSTAPDFYFQQMYYGDHPSFSNPYTLNNLRGSGVPSYLSVTATPTISGRQVTIDVLIIRMKTTTVDTNETDTIRLLGNLTMGTTAVAPQVNNYSKKIADVNYPDAVIGEIVVKNPKPSAAIKDSVDVEATRNALSQDTIKSWFTTLPSNSNDYTFSATGPASWAPGATGTATVVMKHNSNGTTHTFTTRYTVRDTQKPTAKFKNAEIEARRTGGWTREDLLKFIDGNLQDNWSLPENIRIEATDNDGIYPLAGRSPRDTWAYVDIYDEAGNKYGEYVEFKIVDTQRPTGTVKSEVEVEARRSGELSQEELRQFVTNMSDNWTLPENLKIHLVNPSGTPISIAGRAPFSSDLYGYIRLEDEAGNQSLSISMSTTIRIVDTQAPTGTVKSDVTIEARRSGDLSQVELRKLFATMSDNWTLTDNLKVHLVDVNGATATVAGKAPGTHTFYLQLEDEAGNKSARMSVPIRIVDTQAPTGSVKSEVTIEARRSGDLSQAELRGFFSTMSDNWTLSENLKVHFVDGNGTATTIAGRAPGTHDFYLQLEDEAGNKSVRTIVTIRIVDTQAPTGTVKSGTIDVEARRSGNLSQTELRGFMTTMSDNWTLPENMKVYLVNSAGGTGISIAGLEPGTIVSSFDSNIQLEDEAGNKSSRMNVALRIVDTQRPTGTVKSGTIDVEARRSGELSQAELRGFFTTMSDNWTLPENLKIHLVNPSGTPLSIAGKAPLSSLLGYIRLEDEAGNTSLNPSTTIRIVDTQAPTATIKGETIAVEARRTGGLTREELLRFVDGGLSDNWSLPDDISLSVVVPQGTGYIAVDVNQKPGTVITGHLLLTDEFGNQTIPGPKNQVSLNIRDTQAPTGTVKGEVEIEVRRSGDLSQAELRGFLTTMSDNWTSQGNINVHLVDANGAVATVAGKAPGTHTFYLQLEDEAGNKSLGMSIPIRIVDTQAPTGIARDNVEAEARRSGNLSQAELRWHVISISDNWTLTNNVKIHLVDANGVATTVAGKAPGTHNFHLQLEDEAGNKSLVMSVLIRIVDTQRPTGTMKDNIEVEARRSGDLSQAELRKMYTTMNDNWTLPEDMKVQLSFYDGITTVAGIAPGKTVTGVFRLKDEAGNQSFPIGSLIRIVDTQAPTATIKTKGVEIEARRTGEWTREDLLKFIDGDLQDNWSLPEDIRIEATDNHGIIQLAGRGPGDNWAYIDIYDEAGNKYSRYAEFKIVDTQAPTGTLNTVIPTFEYRTQGDWSREELLTFFSGELSDNWSEHKNITATMDRSIVDFSPSVSLQQATLTLTDEAGNKRSYPVQFFLTSFVIEPNVLIQAQRMPALSKETIKSWFQGLPSMVDEHYDFSTPESANGWEPGKAGQANVTIRNKVTNAIQQTTTNYTVVDTQSPEGRVKTSRVTMEADRSRNFTQEELRQFFEELSDNWSYLEDITLKSTGSLSSLGPNTANNHYVLAITATDEEKNSKRFERALLRINDTKAPTGTVKNEHMDIEARRIGDLSQAELRQFFTSVNDNWTLSKDIRFHLVNADGSATSIAGMNPGTSLDAYIQLEDEAGNKSSPMKISANIVDTTGPQGKLKENLAFQKGSAEPNARDYLDGEPSDNWTAPEAIKVTVAYENNADFTDLTVGTHKFVLTLADEYGNTTDLSGELEIKMNLKGYVDVTIPARISFAESKESGGIVSPKYQIQNNSNEELTVSVASMTSQSQTEKLTDIDLLMSNNYNDATIPLIENGQNLSQKTELVTLPKKTSSFAFSLYGTVGQNFDFDSLTDPLKPQYALQFNFAIN